MYSNQSILILSIQKLHIYASLLAEWEQGWVGPMDVFLACMTDHAPWRFITANFQARIIVIQANK